MYFAFVSSEVGHVHLGFEHSVWMADHDNILHGAHLRLRKVSLVAQEPREPVPESSLIEYTRDAARLATMSSEARLARELDRD